MAAGDYVKSLGSDSRKDTGTTLTLTVPAGGVAAGNTVFLVVSLRSGTVSSVADSSLNTYAIDVSDTESDRYGAIIRGDITDALAESDTIVVTLSASTNGHGKVVVGGEYEGAATIDQSTFASSGTGSPASGGVTTTSAAETLIGALAAGGDVSESYVADSPWDERVKDGTTGGAAGANARAILSDDIVASTGTYEFTATLGTSRIWVAMIATYTFSAGGAATVTPAAIAVAVSVPTPSPLAAAVVSPSPVAVAASLPTPSLSVPVAVAPGPVAVSAAMPGPTVSIGKTVEPAAIDVAASMPGATVLAAAVVEPLAVAVVAALPTPTVSVGQIVTPDAVAVATALPLPSVLVAALVTPDPIAVATTVPTPTPSVEASVAPAVIAIATSMPSPTTTGAATVTPAAILVNVAVPTPGIFAGALAIIARAFGQFQRLGSTRLHLAHIGRGGRRGFRIVDENWERVSDIFIYDQQTEADGNETATMAAVADAWATHAGSDADTLKTAIHTALDALGYRRPDGSRLV